MATDSRSFAETAQRLADGRGFAPTLVGLTDAQPFDTVHFPPGLPILLSVLMRLGLSTLAAALVINLVSWVATVVGCAVLYRKAGGRPGIWFVGLMGWLVLGSTMIGLNSAVWSEPLFLALTVWFLVAGERWLAGGGWRWGLLTVVLGASAISVRYVGICLIAAVAVRVLQQGGGLRRIAVRGAAVATMAVPVAIWYLNYRETARADAPGSSGARIKASDAIDSAGSIGSILSGGLLYARNGRILGPLDPVVRPFVVVVGVVALVAAVVVAVRWWRAQGQTTGERIEHSRTGGHLLVVDYVVVSTVFLFAYRILSGFSILPRYWIVVLVPAAPMAAAVASRSPLLEGPGGARWSWATVGVVAFLAASLVTAIYFFP
jgi:hypothetical protein